MKYRLVCVIHSVDLYRVIKAERNNLKNDLFDLYSKLKSRVKLTHANNIDIVVYNDNVHPSDCIGNPPIKVIYIKYRKNNSQARLISTAEISCLIKKIL